MALTGVPHSISNLPDNDTLFRLLRRVTETLAADLAAPGSIPRPDWQAQEWALAEAICVMHGIAPLLAGRSTWAHETWQSFLQGQRDHTARRHQRLMATLQAIDEGARAAGIGLIALKGVELHRLGIYRAGERPMADLDLLVSEPHYAAAVALFVTLGFGAGFESWKDHLFLAEATPVACGFGEHHANPVKIELHRRIVERLPLRLVWLPTALLTDDLRPGINAYPSRGRLMLHLLLHAAGTMPTRTLRMMHLNDLAELATRMSAADWTEVLEAADAASGWWAYPPLRLAGRYFAGRIPERVLRALRENCAPRFARWADRLRLFDASHSYPWVEAFPGIGWSRSMAERFEYIVQRIRPTHETHARRQMLAASEAWTQTDWSRRPQWSRMLRFLNGQQGRPSTMHAVRTALTMPRGEHRADVRP